MNIRVLAFTKSEQMPWVITLLIAIIVLALISLTLVDQTSQTVLGALTLVFLVMSSVYSLRRRMRSLAAARANPAAAWLHWHWVSAGLLFFGFLFHTQGRFPGSALGMCLWLVLLWTLISGVLGWALQRWVPRVLASLSTEVLLDRIPDLVTELSIKAQKTVADSHPSLQNLFNRRLLRRFQNVNHSWIFLFDISGGLAKHMKGLHYLMGFLSGDDLARGQKLEALLKTKVELDAHFTLQSLLRNWLYWHVPAAFALWALVLVHLFTLIYY